MEIIEKSIFMTIRVRTDIPKDFRCMFRNIILKTSKTEKAKLVMNVGISHFKVFFEVAFRESLLRTIIVRPISKTKATRMTRAHVQLFVTSVVIIGLNRPQNLVGRVCIIWRIISSAACAWGEGVVTLVSVKK